MRAGEILQLARAYAQATDLKLSSVGKRALRNDKVFVRLAAGKGCHSKTLDRAERWFIENWPPGVPWPDAVPRPRLSRPAATIHDNLRDSR
jgi:hypothetical protein